MTVHPDQPLTLSFEVRAVTFDFVRIPGGTADIGARYPVDGEEEDLAGLFRAVEAPYYLLDAPLTVRQATILGFRCAGDVHSPATLFSWDEAVGVVGVLEQELAAAARAESYSVHLPSEVQWEIAARAGRPDEFWLQHDESVIDEAVFADLYHDRHAPSVRSCRANPYGLFDMFGTVLVWCRDGMEAYPFGSTRTGWVGDPSRSHATDYRAIRGLAWTARWRDGTSDFPWTRKFAPRGVRAGHIGIRPCLRVR